MNFNNLPEEIELYIVKNYFHYYDIYYLSPVCKKWRDINNYITEVKLFLKYVFETCLIYPLEIPYQREIRLLDLEHGNKRYNGWSNEHLQTYYQTKHPPGGFSEKTEELRLANLHRIKYNSGHFNDNHLNAICQGNNKTLIQLTYIPSNIDFSGLFVDNLNEMKKKIIKLKKKYLRDPKNRGFKIKLHNRRNYTTGAITLIIWR
tara:strand:- start:49 stop:660 length:612 start_codon:yes stop_codon:yes gene_type:complete